MHILLGWRDWELTINNLTILPIPHWVNLDSLIQTLVEFLYARTLLMLQTTQSRCPLILSDKRYKIVDNILTQNVYRLLIILPTHWTWTLHMYIKICKTVAQFITKMNVYVVLICYRMIYHGCGNLLVYNWPIYEHVFK